MYVRMNKIILEEKEMEEIIKKLEEIVNQELDKKIIPSNDVLDIIRLLMTYRFGCL